MKTLTDTIIDITLKITIVGLIIGSIICCFILGNNNMTDHIDDQEVEEIIMMSTTF